MAREAGEARKAGMAEETKVVGTAGAAGEAKETKVVGTAGVAGEARVGMVGEARKAGVAEETKVIGTAGVAGEARVADVARDAGGAQEHCDGAGTAQHEGIGRAIKVNGSDVDGRSDEPEDGSLDDDETNLLNCGCLGAGNGRVYNHDCLDAGNGKVDDSSGASGNLGRANFVYSWEANVNLGERRKLRLGLANVQFEKLITALGTWPRQGGHARMKAAARHVGCMERAAGRAARGATSDWHGGVAGGNALSMLERHHIGQAGAKAHGRNGDGVHDEHGHGRLGKARTWKEWKFLSLEKGRVSESDSLQLRILGETPVGSLEKPESKVGMFNLVFTPGRGGKVLDEELESRRSS